MLIHQVPQPFADMKYIIQLDRRGTSDCVFYNCANEAFIEYVEKFGFIENFGSFSDISEITLRPRRHALWVYRRLRCHERKRRLSNSCGGRCPDLGGGGLHFLPKTVPKKQLLS